MTFERVNQNSDTAFASFITDIDKATDLSGTLIRFIQRIGTSIGHLIPIISRTIIVGIDGFKVIGNAVGLVFNGMQFLYFAAMENMTRLLREGLRLYNQFASKIAGGKFKAPTGLLDDIVQGSKGLRKDAVKGLSANWGGFGKNIMAGLGHTFGSIQTGSVNTNIPNDKRGTVETPLSKTGKGKKAKEGESEAQKEAERYADALKGLKEKARDAMLEVQGMDKAIQALSSGGIKAYEAQLKQNEGLGRYNELMGDYLGKGKKELELLAQSIVKREQDTEAKKKQLELSVSLKQAMEEANIEEAKQKALRDAFLAGGEKALELKQRELDIEQRKRDLLKDSNATDEQKKQAEDLAKKEAKTAEGKSVLEKQVADAKEASEGIRNALRSAFDNTLTYMLNGTASFKEIMVGLLRQVAVQLIKVYTLQLLMGIVGGGQTGGANSGAFGGKLTGVFDKIGQVFEVPVIPKNAPQLSGGFGGRAGGGAVSANKPYMVGESGREMFVPRSAGNIIPSHAMPSGGGGGGITVINNVTVNTQGGGKGDNQGLAEAGKAISEMIEMKVRQVLKTESRQGGMLQRGFA
jgi:phage-related minor tail protein